MITVRVPKDIEERIKIVSQKLGITKSEVIRRALEKFIKEQENGINRKSIVILKEVVDIYSQEQVDLDIDEIYRERVKIEGREFGFD